MDPLVAGLYALSLGPAAGAAAPPVRVPLKSVDAKVEIVHVAARILLRQEYVNESPHAIEAVYRFPVDERGAVCGFEAELEGRKVVGVVRANEDAKAEYEAALQQGCGPGRSDCSARTTRARRTQGGDWRFHHAAHTARVLRISEQSPAVNFTRILSSRNPVVVIT